ncbi:hypothetical protein AN964_24445 [Heyndrickxia shackletonii]|uniref:Uncharacterized protein n=1 Tax=Heyndrickxia shackletonii TaxID=157838 RepID=A0A0Q3TB33_9BACI|nr:hypothetical protein AN964_24445 [Heyndrickxia shackletonii]
MFSILFQYGKIGKIGISIADTFIPWENIESCKLEWLPNTNFFYPNGELTLTTYSQQKYVIIVEKKMKSRLASFLKKILLVHRLRPKNNKGGSKSGNLPSSLLSSITSIN